MTTITGATVLVTGGSRGIGKALVDSLYARGAAKVYATARDGRTVAHPDAVPLSMEITDPSSVAAVAEVAQDVTILINNAGAFVNASFLTSPVDDIRTEFETNFYGPLLVTRAFVPAIEHNGGGHILNMLSAASWHASLGSYSASKAALWSATNALRLELAPRGIAVTALHVGFVDTDLAASFDMPKTTPAAVADAALDGLDADSLEILADDTSRRVKALLAAHVAALYPQLTD
jgi:NAD(P)-dependent dehydrogenase (short-subunit alcohol dehydrogenase family)